MAVHHRALNVKLVVVRHGQINSRHVGEHCHKHNHATLARILNGLPHRYVVARTVINDVRLVRAKRFNERLAEVLLLRVHANVHAAFLGFLQAIITHIGDHHLCRAKAFCRLRHKVADRPRTEHCNVHAGHVAHLLHGVHRHRKRLQHRALFKAHAFRNWCHLRRVHRKVFGSCARRLEAHDFQLLAQIVLAVSARIALAAVHLRLNRHFLPDGKPFDIRTALYNFARDLMSLRHGVFRERMLAVVHVDVRAANADVHNFHQHLPVPDFRHGNFPENDLARLCHNLLKHTLSSQLL